MPVEALDHRGTGLLVGLYDVAPHFGVELAGERRGIDQVTEHDGELAPFGVCGGRRRRWRGDRHRLAW
jgi:hypothetical protein